MSWQRGGGGIDGVMVEGLTDEELYGKYADRLVRFAATLVGPAAAEDVMTDGVVGAMTSRRWPAVEDRVAYLYRSVLNAAKMHHRATSRRRLREERVTHRDQRDVVRSVPEPVPEVREAVAALPPRQRAVVYLTYWEDLDERTTAARLGIGVGSVRRHLHRARQHIGRELRATL